MAIHKLGNGIVIMSRRKMHEAFGIHLGQVARLWRAEIDRRLSPHGLTEAQWLTLLHLSRLAGPATQKRLAAAAGVQEPTMARMLDRLEADGLVTRSPIEGDRRSKSVCLTAKAAPGLDRIRKVTEALREELLADIEDADIDTCLRVLGRLADKLHGATPGDRRAEKNGKKTA